MCGEYTETVGLETEKAEDGTTFLSADAVEEEAGRGLEEGGDVAAEPRVKNGDASS